MRAIDPEETRQIDREKRIEELRRRAKDAGCQMLEGKIEKCPPELEESFWEHVAAWDEAP